MTILIVATAIAALVGLVAVAKVNPFLAFLAVSIGMAIALGVPPADVPPLVQKGLGSILGGLTIVIAAGAMLGRLVVDSGAAQRIATTLVGLFGTSRIAWAMAATGFIVGIPLFYNVGFVLLVPIVFAISGRFGLPAVAVAVPALAALSVAHGLLPPHPAPAGLVKQFDASLGLTLLYGTIVAVPALILAGPVFARFLRTLDARPLPGLSARELPEEQLPGIWTSLLTSLLPALLLVGSTAVEIAAPLVADPAHGVDPNLMVLAVGSGSLACSHVNDAGFWLFKEYFRVSIPATFRCWTAMETIVSIVGLAGVLVLARIV